MAWNDPPPVTSMFPVYESMPAVPASPSELFLERIVELLEKLVEKEEK